MPDLDVNENSAIYYQGRYWNDLDIVVRRINERISGDPTCTWNDHFAKACDRTFHRALSLNCGNGWVERELLVSGLIDEAVGIDYSEELLQEARAAASQQGLPLRYERTNINSGPLPADAFDLVVNHAAAHHIAAIDRVLREICRILPEDGFFVSFDYVGPHRNQYTPEAWEEMWTMNRLLPDSLRQDLAYPHLPTMLLTDPTEAIHSELIMETFHRYFTVDQFTPLGGAIAYPLLTHNTRLFEARDAVVRDQWVDRILEADDAFLREHPDSSLFAYFVGRPNKSVLQQVDQLAKWQAEETERERRAAEAGGEYYDRSALSTAVIELENERCETARAKARLEMLEVEIAKLRSDRLYSAIRRVLDADLVRSTRGNRFVGAVERRLRAARSRASG